MRARVLGSDEAIPPKSLMSGARLEYGQADAAFFRMLTAFAPPAVYRDDRRGPEKRIIMLVEDDGDLVDTLRRDGLPAWGMAKYGGWSRWFFRGELWASPVTGGVAQVAAFMDPVLHIHQVMETAVMVAQGGFLILDIHLARGTDNILRGIGFERLPMDWHHYSVWRRRHEGEKAFWRGQSA